MSDRPTHTPDPAASPAPSQHSTYFDAPIKIWDKEITPSISHSRSQTALFVATDANQTSSGNIISHQPSVSIPRDPIIKERPADESIDDEMLQGLAKQRSLRAQKHIPLVGKRSTSPPSDDSGYDSAKAARSASEAGSGLKPIPVLWTGTPTDNLPRSQREHKDGPAKRAVSLQSFHSQAAAGAADRDRTDHDSIRTTPSGFRSQGDRRSRSASVREALRVVQGLAGANAGLNEKQQHKIGKIQLKEGKRVAQVIKAEAQVEKKALQAAIKELSDIQKLQRAAVKVRLSLTFAHLLTLLALQEESKSYATYAGALRTFHKEELAFFAARARYDQAQVELQTHEEIREASRNHARDATEMLQEKNREVEWLRAQKAVDDLEREAKIRQLSGKA
ncbi:hypothetical protein A0H81_07710 [Grifola frondosa]|uniref:Uncharacterized protein n=1 Tax=Grifola frondosa TaxID=5627 RepID=A0A1C7M5Q7_GRIFR|nr:hypothetical protein A0H81_07710 [Grifola frondosa]